MPTHHSTLKMNMNRAIGYLLPEFPGQTHIFWWREMNALTRMGIDIDIVSTRRPLSKPMSHKYISILTDIKLRCMI